MIAPLEDSDDWNARFEQTRRDMDRQLGVGSGAEVDDLMLRDPEQAQRLLKGYHLLLGRVEGQREDLRIGALPQTTHADPRRFSMGLEKLTELASPIRPRELVVMGAITGQGKTSFAERVALENGREHRVLFATLEMTAEEIRDRCISKIMRACLDNVHAARVDRHPDYLAAMDHLQSLDLMLWEPGSKERTIEMVCRRAEDVTADFLIIDYTRKLTGWEPGRKGTAIVDWLWEWIKATNIPTLLLTQVKRPEGRVVNKRPTIQDYQDTSALEATSTRSLILWRPFAGKPRFDHIAEIIVGKNRFGPMLTTHAHWVGASSNLGDMTDEEDDNALCCKRRRGSGKTAGHHSDDDFPD